MTNITFKLRTPKVPNFIIIDNGKVGQRQDGFRELPTVSLGDLSDEQINELADQYRLAMLERAKIQRREITNR